MPSIASVVALVVLLSLPASQVLAGHDDVQVEPGAQPNECIDLPCACAEITETESCQVGVCAEGEICTSQDEGCGCVSFLNHFQCYGFQREPFDEVPDVSLDDAFGASVVDVVRISRLCNPANKMDEAPNAVDDPDHLMAFKIRQRTPRFRRIRDVEVTTQFGPLMLDVIRPIALMVPTTKSLIAPVSVPPSDPGVDHFKCYQVKRVRQRVADVGIEDQFGILSLDLKRPGMLCAPADKLGEDPNAVGADGHLLCYRIRSRPRFVDFEGPVWFANQFVPEGSIIEVQNTDGTRPTELCVPATIRRPGEPSPSPSPAVTPSITASPTPSPTASLTPTTTTTPTGSPTPTPSPTDDPNRPPDVTSAPVTSGTEGQAYAYDVEATDPDLGDLLEYSLDFAPTGMTIDRLSGLIEWTPAADQTGRHGVIARVVDDGGLADTDPFVVDVEPLDPEFAPVLDPIDDQTITAGMVLTTQAAATDDDAGDIPTFSLDEAPPGMTIDGPTGLITWPTSADDAGAHLVIVRVTDLTGLFDTTSFIVIVDRNLPPIAADDAYAVREGTTLSIAAPGVLANDVDPNGDPLTAATVTPPTTGAFALDPSGAFDYTPAAPVHSGVFTPVVVVDTNLSVALPNPLPSASSALDNAPTHRAFDDDLDTSWFAADVVGEATYELEFHEDITVDEIRAFGPRNVTARHFLNGTFQLFSAADVEVFNSGLVLFPAPDQDAVVAVGGVANVRRLRFSSSSYNTNDPGFAELHVIGDGEIYASNVVLEGRTIGPRANEHPTDSTFAVGDLDGNGAADIITQTNTAGIGNVRWSAYDGATGASLWQIDTFPFFTGLPDIPQFVSAGADSPTLCDIDGDDRPEVLIVGSEANQTLHERLAAFEHDGTLKWVGESIDTTGGVGSGLRNTSPAFADLDGDGDVEIIVGYGGDRITVFDHDGKVVFHADGGGNQLGNGNSTYTAPIVTDLDLDGALEIIYGDDVYGPDGTVKWSGTLLSGSGRPNVLAVANLDDDPFGEIVWSTSAHVEVREHDGTQKWLMPDEHWSGAISIADVDGDGRPEIIGANNFHIRVLGHDGALKWVAGFGGLVSGGARATTAFDFDGDGLKEVVAQDRDFVLFIDGVTGRILARVPAVSRGGIGVPRQLGPLVADSDGDGEAEVLARNHVSGSATSGILRYGPATGSWAATRPIWNQISYHVTNIDPDGGVPSPQQVNWLTPGLNNYRVNATPPGERVGREEEFTYLANDGEFDSNLATVALHVLPANDAPVIVSLPPTGGAPDLAYFYLVNAVDPDAGEILTFTLPNGPAGMTIDSATGLVSWTPTTGQLGRHLVRVQVTDSQGEADSQTYFIDVAAALLVPSVVGMAEAAAETTLVDATLTVGLVSTRSSGTVAAGDVISQNPVADTEVAPGSPIDLIISSGPAPTVVPDVVGFLETAAASTLVAADLAPGFITRANSTTVPKGSVIDQTPGAGAAVVTGSSVDLTVSSGAEVAVSLSATIAPAGTTIDYAVEVVDANGDPLVPQPPVDVVVDSAPGESEGTPPVAAGGQITTAADTLGSFILRATVQGSSGATGEAAFLVSPNDDQQIQFADLGAAIRALLADFAALDAALTSGDLAAVPGLLASLVSTRDAIDLDELRRTPAFAPGGGFLPTTGDLDTAGFPSTPADVSFANLTQAIIDQLALMQSEIESLAQGSPFDDDARTQQRNDELDLLVDQLIALDPTVHGPVAAASLVNHLLAVRIPALLHADITRIEAVLQDAGLASQTRSPGRFYAALDEHDNLPAYGLGSPATWYGNTRNAFFTVGGISRAASIQMRIINKVYVPYIKQLLKAGLIIALNDLFRAFVDPADLAGVITTASLSIHSFNIPGSVIEGTGFGTNFPEENDVFLIGPAAIDAVNGVINSINPSNVKNLNDLKRKFDQAKKAATAVVNAFDQANSTPASVVRGCLFDLSPTCHELVYPAGFASVLKPVAGAFPGPVFIVVRNVTTGQFAVTIQNFFPAN